MNSAAPTIGVLALQGDVREHLRVLAGLGAHPRPVRRPHELVGVHGLILPGGESTTMSRLLDVFELREPLVERLDGGLPAYGSCAGMIMLASRILDGRPDQRPLGALDITVRRNAFGRQVDSFETDLAIDGVPGGPMHAVFIRAPWVESVDSGVRVLASVPVTDAAASVTSRPVAVQQGAVLATSFHPEITADHRLHELFLQAVRQG